MNWLAICRRIARECGMSATDTTPSSVVGQSGEMLSVVTWAGDAWLALQAAKLWGWLWEQPELTLAAGANTIAASVSAHRYDKESMYVGTRLLTYMRWDDFRTTYPQGAIGDGTPSMWTVRPDRSLAFNAKPTADLALTVERFRNPTTMPTANGADDETPDGLPDYQHMAIVWRAVMFYAGHDEAGNLYQHAKAEYTRLMGEAVTDDLPDFEEGAPLC